MCTCYIITTNMALLYYVHNKERRRSSRLDTPSSFVQLSHYTAATAYLLISGRIKASLRETLRCHFTRHLRICRQMKKSRDIRSDISERVLRL